MTTMLSTATTTTTSTTGADELTWFYRAASYMYRMGVAAYAQTVGEENAHTVVGNLAIAFLGILTLMTAWCAFREIGELWFRMLKLVALLALIGLLTSLLVDLLSFVYPTTVSVDVAQTFAKKAANDSQAWFINKVWRRHFGV